jgi:hypothetical protein
MEVLIGTIMSMAVIFLVAKLFLYLGNNVPGPTIEVERAVAPKQAVKLNTVQVRSLPPYVGPYSAKTRLMSNAEHEIFKSLQKIAGSDYFVFPQVHYGKIIKASGQQNYKNPYINKIDRKSADFVLFDKEKISPVLVIEVDDSTHKRKERIARDQFINKLLMQCKIPILRIHPYFSESGIKNAIDMAVGNRSLV